MEFFDSHTHLHDEKFERDMDRVIERAKAAGVTRFLTLGDNVENSRRAVALARKFPEVLAAVGVHPHAASEWTPAAEHLIEELSEATRVVAIGEIGLDYHHHHFGHEKQREVFRRQLAIARNHNQPVSMHSRDSYPDLIEDLRAEDGAAIGGVCHCFSGTLDDARALVDMGFYLGVGGTCTYPKAEDLRTVLQAIGLRHIILETDSPYLAPQAKRGRRNEPANIPIIARAVAEFLGESYRDVARISVVNTERALRLAREHAPAVVYINQNRININLTNLCTNSCDFCVRHADGIARGHQMLLGSEEPRTESIIRDIIKPEYEPYQEVVFSGLGEAIYRLDDLVRIARAARKAGKRVVLQTNGQGELVHGPELWNKIEGELDQISVSINAPDQKTYNELCHPQDPERAFPAVLAFVRESRRRGIDTIVTAIDLPEVNLKSMRELGRQLGVPIHILTFDAPIPENVLH